jgi:hypothetical protein
LDSFWLREQQILSGNDRKKGKGQRKNCKYKKSNVCESDFDGSQVSEAKPGAPEFAIGS